MGSNLTVYCYTSHIDGELLVFTKAHNGWTTLISQTLTSLLYFDHHSVKTKCDYLDTVSFTAVAMYTWCPTLLAHTLYWLYKYNTDKLLKHYSSNIYHCINHFQFDAKYFISLYWRKKSIFLSPVLHTHKKNVYAYAHTCIHVGRGIT